MKKIKLTGKHGSSIGNFAIVDDEDFESMNAITWNAHLENTVLYAVEVLCGASGGKSKRYMHKILGGGVPGLFVRHINGVSLDNRRSNLSLGTHSNTGKTRFRDGITPWNKGKPGYALGELSGNWKGDAVGYQALHGWVYRRLGKALKCQECGGDKNVQWANKSGKYRRVESDWVQLCAVHHRRYDGITKLSKEQAQEARIMHVKGVSQAEIAKLFNVTQGTISNILRGKIKFYG